MICNKRQLNLVVDGMEFCITASPERIYLLEDFLMELHISKTAVNYTLSESDFIAFQEKLGMFLKSPSSRKKSKKQY